MNQYSDRKFVFIVIIILSGFVFIGRLFQMQVLDKSYEKYALSNAQSIRISYPARGLILDRNGISIVENQAAHDIMVVPRELSVFDTTELCKILQISRESMEMRLEAARDYSSRVPSVFMKQLGSEQSSLLREKMFKYPGFYVQERTLRKYPRSIAAHALGYVGEVDQKILESDPYYQLGHQVISTASGIRLLTRCLSVYAAGLPTHQLGRGPASRRLFSCRWRS